MKDGKGSSSVYLFSVAIVLTFEWESIWLPKGCRHHEEQHLCVYTFFLFYQPLLIYTLYQRSYIWLKCVHAFVDLMGESCSSKSWDHWAAVAGTALARWDIGNVSDMNHGGVDIKDALMRCRVSGGWATATELWRKKASSLPLRTPLFRNRKSRCPQFVWLQWLPHKQPTERS